MPDPPDPLDPRDRSDRSEPPAPPSRPRVSGAVTGGTGGIGVAGEGGRAGGRPRPVATVTILVLLTAQIVALLLVGTYARATPRLYGFPFFYWYTLLWLGIGATSMAGCALLSREPAEGR